MLFKKKKLYVPTLWMGFNCLRATEPKSQEIPGTHLIELEKMKGATQSDREILNLNTLDWESRASTLWRLLHCFIWCPDRKMQNECNFLALCNIFQHEHTTLEMQQLLTRIWFWLWRCWEIVIVTVCFLLMRTTFLGSLSLCTYDAWLELGKGRKVYFSLTFSAAPRRIFIPLNRHGRPKKWAQIF